MSERLPPPNRARIAATAVRDGERLVLAAGTRVARLHPLGGTHPTAWNEMRSFGPTTSRFDHHTAPRRTNPTRSIAYLTHGRTRFLAAIAEYYQDANGGVGPIDRAHLVPTMTQFELVADLDLLDLDSGWIARAGGNQAIISGSRFRAREWARAIYASHPTVQGLAYGSSVWGPGQCIALWERGFAIMPATPLTSRTLVDPALDAALAHAAIALGAYFL